MTIHFIYTKDDGKILVYCQICVPMIQGSGRIRKVATVHRMWCDGCNHWIPDNEEAATTVVGA